MIDMSTTNKSEQQLAFRNTEYYKWLERFMKTFTDEDMKKYTKEALFFELRSAYVTGYFDGKKVIDK